MNEKNTKWKDYLLKSSIPLEYEVKKIFDEKGCVGSYDYTYLRRDENEVINEFSYDLDLSYIKNEHFFELMVECKYRDISTNWIFIPEKYRWLDDIESYSFLNPNDHFNKKTKFQKLEYEIIAPLCGKGIEINSGGTNPKTITQAVNQLSYAMAEKIVSGMEHQIDELLGGSEFIFYNIPIIITTANLYRLNENVSIEQIKKAKDIIQVTSKEDCLILKTPNGKHLENYNQKIFQNFIEKRGLEFLNKKLNSFNDDIRFIFSVIAQNYSPSALAVINFSEQSKGIDILFNFLDEVVKPSKETLNKTKRKEESGKKFIESLKDF